MRAVFLSLLFFVSQSSNACPVNGPGVSIDVVKKWKTAKVEKINQRNVANNSEMPVLPTAASSMPWGGADRSNWKPEAILANSASFWLNTGWQMAGVADVLVSFPAKMLATGLRPYGDGQTNAGMHFGEAWTKSHFDHPPMTAMLVTFKNQERRIIFNFAQELKLQSKLVNVVYFDSKNLKQTTVVQILQKDGMSLAGWKVPADVKFGDLEKSRVVWVEVKMEGQTSTFPIDFRMVIVDNNSLINAAGDAKTDSHSPMDPKEVGAIARKNHQTVQSALQRSDFAAPWFKFDSGAFVTQLNSIHGEANGRATAVGGGHTWFTPRGPGSKFKNLYTCFDARNFNAEKNSGLPSGGGWHEIGDAAETIINDLEMAPVPVGFATGLPWPTPPGNNKFALGLTDVITVRLLRPGEAMMTEAGDQTWREDEDWRKDGNDRDPKRGSEPSGGGRNYHWFFFPSDQPTCTQEWVHHCRPSENENFGLRCP